MNAINYFYPNGAWGGYVKFFEPTLSDRLGELLFQNIISALRGDECAQQIAKAMFQTTFSKNEISEKGAGTTVKVFCCPTDEAKVAIGWLDKAIAEKSQGNQWECIR